MEGLTPMVRERIAVIEDEPDILEVLVYNLKREGYRTVSAMDGELGLELIRQEVPDLVLLDLMLPGLDGLEICRRMKADPTTSSIPIIMVSAKGEESDIVLGLELGADDYIAKPFSTRQLIARVRAVARRGPLREQREEGTVVSGEVAIDPSRHEIRVEDTAVEFTATEFRLTHFLAQHPGRVFTRDQLLNRIIGGHALVIDRNIDVHVRSIRKKLGNHSDMIETVRGVGYRWKSTE